MLFGHLPGDDEPLGNVLQGGLVAEQVVVLEYKGRLFAQAGDIGAAGVGEVEVFAIKGQLAAVGGLEKVQTPQKGGLAGAGRAEDGDHVALFHGQVHALQNIQLTEQLLRTGAVKGSGLCIGAEGFADIADLKHCHGFHTPFLLETAGVELAFQQRLQLGDDGTEQQVHHGYLAVDGQEDVGTGGHPLPGHEHLGHRDVGGQ